MFECSLPFHDSTPPMKGFRLMKFRVFSLCMLTVVLCTGALTAVAAPTVPFTEDFTTDTANWKNNGNADLTFFANGGPGNSSYVSTSFAFASAFGDQIALFRGQSGFNSSGGAFNGNWLTEGVNRL